MTKMTILGVRITVNDVDSSKALDSWSIRRPNKNMKHPYSIFIIGS